VGFFFFASEGSVKYILQSTCYNLHVTLSTAMNLSAEILFQNIQILHSILFNLANFGGGANFEKHADPKKQNRNSRKSRENSRNLLEAFLRSRKEENLYGHCDMNNLNA